MLEEEVILRTDAVHLEKWLRAILVNGKGQVRHQCIESRLVGRAVGEDIWKWAATLVHNEASHGQPLRQSLSSLLVDFLSDFSPT